MWPCSLSGACLVLGPLLMGKRRPVRASRFLMEMDGDDLLWRHAESL